MRSRLAEKDLGALVGSTLDRSQECAPTAKRANHFLEYIKYSITKWSKIVITLPCTARVWPHLKYSVKFWVFKCIQRREIKLLKSWMHCNMKSSSVWRKGG